MNNVFKPRCRECGSFLDYEEKWDAYFCDTCDNWQENKCLDVKCWFCVNRPEKPSFLKR